MLVITTLVTKSVRFRWGEAPQLGLLLTASQAEREVRTKPRKVCSDAWDWVKLVNYQSLAVSLSWSFWLRKAHGSDRIWQPATYFHTKEVSGTKMQRMSVETVSPVPTWHLNTDALRTGQWHPAGCRANCSPSGESWDQMCPWDRVYLLLGERS